MPAAYLDWLVDLFDDAQIPYTPETADYLDRSLRKLVDGAALTEEEVFGRLRHRWLKHGPSGRQLLHALLRDEFYVRRDSPYRPTEGGGYYTNDYKPSVEPPHGGENSR
jgi:hypothetical protein